MGSDGNDTDEDGGPFRATWNPEDPDSLTGAIVNTVAEARGVDGMELSELLNDVLDPDALARVLASGSGTVTVTFTLDGQSVTVDSEGAVIVEPAAE
ncbi:HalOD1 output domain-containing protein [Halorientalis pallida]|uniref:HalOD1 output domain-containing protein n=1 Tax=Halorientalis pallida TaxID=2479928 RepID=UPI003C6EF4F3